jgi:hypothetical protein
MTEQPTLETLSDGLSSPFWSWFQAYVTREWGPSGLRYQQAVQNAAKDPNAVIELQKVLAAQDAVYTLMKHPAERLSALRQAHKTELRLHAPSRRGPGL